MKEVISVRFRSGCKNYYFSPGQLTVAPGQDVIVETAQGPEYVTCTQGNHTVEDHQVVEPLRRVLRPATENDRRSLQMARAREKEAFAVCQKKIAQRGLEMKLVRAESSFDGNKLLFFFTADGRVDFRELVKDLAAAFHARIELRQIGVRDEAKMLGGLGICGRPFCCSQYMDDFIPVSIKMAKTQNLSLNPAKISGTCGRLMCCLKYEQEAYEDAARRMPKNDSFVQTPDGPGNISAVNLLKEQVTVRLDDQPESPGATTTARSASCATARAAATASRCPGSAPPEWWWRRSPRSSRRWCPTSSIALPRRQSPRRRKGGSPAAPAAIAAAEAAALPRTGPRRRIPQGPEAAPKQSEKQADKQTDKPRPPRRRGGQKPEGAAPQAAKPQPPSRPPEAR
ncbi:MAG: regulatory iron-sulfur-containing complex subunit RicT [Oscillospiraceae bacterium]